MKFKFHTIISITFILTIPHLSCLSDISEADLEQSREWEARWVDCFESRFHFPNDPAILDNDYLSCFLNGERVLINSSNSHYKASIYYSTAGTTYDPSVIFENESPISYKVLIGFQDNEYLKGFKISIPYRPDSLNYAVQNALSNNTVELPPGNWFTDWSSFNVETSCNISGSIDYTTLVAIKESQSINIDKFSYYFSEDKWHYKLEYSFDKMKLRNGSINYENEFVKESEALVKNIEITNFKCSINFELPPG